VTKQKLAQPVPGPKLILFRRLACVDQVPQCFVRLVGNPDCGEVAGTVAARRLLRIAAIG
jgi:hypothetical protein